MLSKTKTETYLFFYTGQKQIKGNQHILERLKQLSIKTGQSISVTQIIFDWLILIDNLHQLTQGQIQSKFEGGAVGSGGAEKFSKIW